MALFPKYIGFKMFDTITFSQKIIAIFHFAAVQHKTVPHWHFSMVCKHQTAYISFFHLPGRHISAQNIGILRVVQVPIDIAARKTGSHLPHRRSIRFQKFQVLPKKEVMKLLGEMEKLEKYLGGVKEMKKLPGALFVVDPRKEHNAIAESRKLHIPIVAIVDTNCDPDEIDYVIPANDDAIRAIRLISSTMANAVQEGRQGADAEEAASEEEAQKVEE